jgi:hypothetical protein
VDPGVLFDEKTMGRKSRETVPLTERMEKYESVESVNPE